MLDRWIAEQTGIAPFSPEALAHWQCGQLRQALGRAREHSPFYRAHLEGTEEPRSLADIQSLPFMDAGMLAEQGPAMLCVPLGAVERIRTLPTSGSMGAPKRVWFTQGDMERTADFFSIGMRPMAKAGETVAVLMGSERPGSIADLLRQGLARIGVEARCCPAEWGADLLLGPQGIAGAHCIVGSPAQMLYLCRKAPALRPKAVLLSADYISPSVADALQQAWRCRVYSHYGLTESCYGLAVQCNALEGQHLRAADFIVEIIDPLTGEPVPDGQQGEIVLTTLRSEALPLIRYRTGDTGALVKGPCACGSPLPRLGRVLGRGKNLAQPVNIHLLDDILFAQPGVLGYAARWQGGALALTIEGALPEAAELARRLGVPVYIQAGHASPFKQQAKRNIEGAPPWENA